MVSVNCKCGNNSKYSHCMEKEYNRCVRYEKKIPYTFLTLRRRNTDGKKSAAYFSASGTTRKIAEMIVETAEADLYEIVLKQPYSKADLNWMDKNSRSSVEMSDKKQICLLIFNKYCVK